MPWYDSILPIGQAANAAIDLVDRGLDAASRWFGVDPHPPPRRVMRSGGTLRGNVKFRASAPYRKNFLRRPVKFSRALVPYGMRRMGMAGSHVPLNRSFAPVRFGRRRYPFRRRGFRGRRIGRRRYGWTTRLRQGTRRVFGRKFALRSRRQPSPTYFLVSHYPNVHLSGSRIQSGTTDLYMSYGMNQISVLPDLWNMRCLFARQTNLAADLTDNAVPAVGYRIGQNIANKQIMQNATLKFERTFVFRVPNAMWIPGNAADEPPQPQINNPFTLWIYVVVPRKGRISNLSTDEALRYGAVGNPGLQVQPGVDWDICMSAPWENTGFADTAAVTMRAPYINRDRWKIMKKRVFTFSQGGAQQFAFKLKWNFTGVLEASEYFTQGNWQSVYNRRVPRVLIISSGIDQERDASYPQCGLRMFDRIALRTDSPLELAAAQGPACENLDFNPAITARAQAVTRAMTTQAANYPAVTCIL